MPVNHSRWRSKKADITDVPRPIVEIRQNDFNNNSVFDNSTMIGLNSVWVRTPDFNTDVFVAANEPVLELCWYRKRWGTGEGRESGTPNKGWAFPDDSVFKYGSDQGGGSQMNGNGQTAIARRSKWDATGVSDLEHVTGQRIELEHYFKLSDVKLLSAETEPAGGWPTINAPVPTFVPYVANSPVFSTSQFDISRTTPRYHGYWNGYFAFAFSIKDPNGTHDGDRLRGPISDTVQVRAATSDGGFPIWPTENGFADGESVNHLKAFIV